MRKIKGIQEYGFTLIELVITMGILLISILGVIAVYHHSIILSQYSQGHTLALQSAQAKLEEMRNHPYGQLTMDYGSGGTPGDTFVPAGLNGRGGITLDTTDPSVLGVRIFVCWEEKERLFGEDQDLDGRLDTGEDANGNGLLDGPVELVTYFTEQL